MGCGKQKDQSVRNNATYQTMPKEQHGSTIPPIKDNATSIPANNNEAKNITTPSISIPHKEQIPNIPPELTVEEAKKEMAIPKPQANPPIITKIDEKPIAVPPPIAEPANKKPSPISAALYTDEQFTPLNSLGGEITKKYQWKRCSEIIGSQVVLYNDITVNDIKQGEIGDCYFMCALTGFAMYPELVKSFFTTDKLSPSGMYQVKMTLNNTETIVTIDDLIPCIEGSVVPAFSKPNLNQIWVMLLEKAWAKANRTYSDIIKNNPSYPVKVFTGAPSNFYKHSDTKDHNELWSYITSAIATKQVASGSIEEAIPNSGLVGHHVYAILTAKEITVASKKVKLVKLRNPWGGTEWNGHWSDKDNAHWTDEAKRQMNFVNADDGCFHMCLEDYMKYFETTVICRIRPNYTPSRILLGGYDIGGYSYCKISFPKDFTGYIFATYLEYKLLGSNVGKFEAFYVNIGIWKALPSGKYEFIAKQNMNAPCIFLLSDAKLAKGDYIVMVECLGKDPDANKVLINVYGTTNAVLTDLGKIPNDGLEKLMVACSSKVKADPLKDEPQITSYFNYMEGGVSFSSYMISNKTSNKTVHETVKFSDSSIKCFPPYDQKVGEFDIEVGPGKDEVVLFRPKLSFDDKGKGNSLGISFSYIIKLPNVDIMSLINEKNISQHYESNGKKVSIFLHSLTYNQEMYLVFINKSNNAVLMEQLKLKLTNLETEEKTNEYNFNLKPNEHKIIHMKPMGQGGMSYSTQESYSIEIN